MALVEFPPEEKRLLMTAFPRGEGPYTTWVLSVESTGLVIADGPMPIDQQAVRAACDAYWQEVWGAGRVWDDPNFLLREIKEVECSLSYAQLALRQASASVIKHTSRLAVLKRDQQATFNSSPAQANGGTSDGAC